MKNKLFYIEYSYGCGIRAYKTLKQAIKEERRLEGENNFQRARLATEEDINNVRAMCGYIPEIK